MIPAFRCDSFKNISCNWWKYYLELLESFSILDILEGRSSPFSSKNVCFAWKLIYYKT